ncbi:hypothetical protein ACOMHN_014024 [Nucella lapillus]
MEKQREADDNTGLATYCGLHSHHAPSPERQWTEPFIRHYTTLSITPERQWTEPFIRHYRTRSTTALSTDQERTGSITALTISYHIGHHPHLKGHSTCQH